MGEGRTQWFSVWRDSRYQRWQVDLWEGDILDNEWLFDSSTQAWAWLRVELAVRQHAAEGLPGHYREEW